jgi:hypothetical protein
MLPAFHATVAVLVMTTSATLQAQSGSGYGTGNHGLSARVEATYLQADLSDGSRTTRWIQFVVLWRGQADWSAPNMSVDTAAQRHATEHYHTARKAALLADAVFLGGQTGAVSYFAEVDSARTTLTILGQRFRLPPRDSALIVLVDRVDRVGGDPVVAGSTVVDARLPDASPTRTWTSGDTTFTIRSRNDVRNNLETILLRDRTVGAFWR